MNWALADERPRRPTREELLAEVPADVRDAALSVLQSPNLLAWIATGIEVCGVAGEHLLAMLVYLTGTSRLLDKPLAIIVQGPSASGKSYVLEKVADLFPPTEVLTATDITDNALHFEQPGHLSHRFVVAGERPRGQKQESGQGNKAWREMLSSGKLSKYIAQNDGSGFRTVLVEQPGPIAYAESTTATSLYEEDANRCLILQSDERPEQTERILLAHGRRCAGRLSDVERQDYRTVFHALQLLLERCEVVVPFAEALAVEFPKEPLEVRRLYGLVLSTVQALALLHQHQRGRDELGRIIAQPEDYAIARWLLADVLARSLGRKDSESLKRFVDRLRPHAGEFTARQLAQMLQTNERTVREQLQALLERGLVEQISEARGPKPAWWRIPNSLTLWPEGKSPLPSVADVCGIDEEQLQLPEMPANWGSANLTEVPF